MAAWNASSVAGQIPSGNVGSEGFVLGLQCHPPLSLTLSDGGVYALTIRPDLGHVNLLASVVAANLARGARCAVMSPIEPAALLRRADARLAQQLDAAAQTGQLALLAMVGDYRHNLARFGAERLTEEWARCGVEPASLLVIHQAEQLLSLHHPELALEQFDAYQRWLADRACAALLLFSAAVDDPMCAAGYRRVLERAAGSARLHCLPEDAALWIDFWQSGSQLLAERRLALAGAGAGSAPTSGHPLLASGSGDADQVYCLGRIALAADVRRPAAWRQVRDLVDLIHATCEARAATVLVEVTRDTDWLQLAQTIHAVRRQCGQMMRIAILDPDRALRYQDEVLLLHLGANTVVHDRMAVQRLPLLLQSLRAQHYVVEREISFEEAVAGATPPRAKGYLPAPRFHDEVRAAVTKSHVLGVPCALAVLPGPANKERVAALMRYPMSRQGDLLTVNRLRCYVFLYGCTTADLRTLLPRLLGLQEASALQDATLLGDSEAILAAIAALESRAWHQDVETVQEAAPAIDGVQAVGAN